MKLKKINLGDLIFILLYKYGGEIRGSTTIQKLIDIVRLDSELEVDVSYSPYDYGDFAPEINDVILWRVVSMVKDDGGSGMKTSMSLFSDISPRATLPWTMEFR